LVTQARIMLGSACAHCGSTEDLEFDHIDPATKSGLIIDLASRRADVFWAEVRKCQLLCRSCHRAKTAAEGGWGLHGKIRTYQNGCRCGECRTAIVTWNREWRRRRRLQDSIPA
jgi:hypothetical protein